MFFNPLLVFAVDWGMVELVCALLLLVLWLRTRDGHPDRPDWVDGLLAGLLCLLRLDLFWVPLLWWILPWDFSRRPDAASPAAARRLGLVLLAWLVVIAPWAIRNLQVTGQPFFSLQGSAEHVKDTRDWPGYSRLPATRPPAIFRDHDRRTPCRSCARSARGMKFYFRDLHRPGPRSVLLVLAAGAWSSWLARRRSEPAAQVFPPDPSSDPWPCDLSDHGPVVRPVLVFRPQSATSAGSAAGDVVGILPLDREDLAQVAGQHQGDRVPLPDNLGPGHRLWPRRRPGGWCSFFPAGFPGWDSAAAEAVQLAPRTTQQIDRPARSHPTECCSWTTPRCPGSSTARWSGHPPKRNTRDRICESPGATRGRCHDHSRPSWLQQASLFAAKTGGTAGPRPRGPDFRGDPPRADHEKRVPNLASAAGLKEGAWARQVHGGTVLEVTEGGIRRRGRCPVDRPARPGSDRTRGRLSPDPGGREPGGRIADLGIRPRLLAVHGSGHHRGTRPGDDGTGSRAAETLRAVICPSAGPCCYEVGEEVRRAAPDFPGTGSRLVFPGKNRRSHLRPMGRQPSPS